MMRPSSPAAHGYEASGRGVPSVLVAGVGNLFLRDDGWGCEVARQLGRQQLPEGVRVVDYGIGGIHLAYELLDGVDLLVLLDALPRGVEPGTVTLMETDPDASPRPGVDSHAMDPATVLASVRALGGTPPPTLLVGCEPADVSEGIGLSPALLHAIAPAIDLVHEVLAKHGQTPEGPREAAPTGTG
jgi:hydrogenase maturation protease